MDNEKVIYLYTVKHLTMQEIARAFNITRQAIHKRLKKAGIDAKEGTYVLVKCKYCQKKLIRNRASWRQRINGIGCFCGSSCYYAHIRNDGYREWRHGGRIDRAVVGIHFSLDKDYVVHHVDGDSRNNDISNLWVFRNQADHMSYHRTGRSKPIFKGSNI